MMDIELTMQQSIFFMLYINLLILLILILLFINTIIVIINVYLFLLKFVYSHKKKGDIYPILGV